MPQTKDRVKHAKKAIRRHALHAEVDSHGKLYVSARVTNAISGSLHSLMFLTHHGKALRELHVKSGKLPHVLSTNYNRMAVLQAYYLG